jgi:hypothetical protein
LERDSTEAFELLWRLTGGSRIANIDLEYLGAVSRAGVAHLGRDHPRVRSLPVQVDSINREVRIGEPVSERVERLLAVFLVIAVADENPLVVEDGVVDAGELRRCLPKDPG